MCCKTACIFLTETGVGVGVAGLRGDDGCVGVPGTSMLFFGLCK